MITVSYAVTSFRVSICSSPGRAFVPLTVMVLPLPTLTNASKGLLDVPISVPLSSTVRTPPPAEPDLRLAALARAVGPFLASRYLALVNLLTALIITLSAVTLVLVPISTLALLVISLSTPAPLPTAKPKE